LVAVAGSATVRRRACAGYLGGHRPPLQTDKLRMTGWIEKIPPEFRLFNAGGLVQ
jgi:hypothetical protein